MWIQKLRCGVQHLAYSLDGRLLYALDTGSVLTIWDVATHSGLPIATELYFRGNFPRGLHPLRDGRLLIRNSGFPLQNQNHELILIDKSGNVTASEGPAGLRDGFAQVCDDARVHYIGDAGQRIVTWDFNSRSSQPSFSLPENAGFPSGISRFDLSRDGRSLVTLRNHELTLFETTADGKSHDLIPLDTVPRSYRVKFSPDGKTVAVFVTDPSHVSLWDVASRSVRVQGIECAMPWGLFAFNPVYPLFAMCQKDGTLAIWNLEDGRPVRSVDFALGKSVRSVAFSPDGLTCAVGGTNKQFAVFDVDV